MDKTPLVRDEIEAGEEFIKKMNDYRPVKAACWLRSSDDEERYLHVARDGLTARNAGLAYVEVLRIEGELKDHYLDPFRIKLIGTDDPLARAVVEVYRRYPGRSSSQFHAPVLGGVPVAEVYIYYLDSEKP